jgi:hypothetical protein
MSKYETRMRSLESRIGEPLHKVYVATDDPAETERERLRYLAATRGLGSFVVIAKEAADL